MVSSTCGLKAVGLITLSLEHTTSPATCRMCLNLWYCLRSSSTSWLLCGNPLSTTTGWRLVLAGGHFCNKAKKNYSPIEGEATAVAKDLQDTKYYTM